LIGEGEDKKTPPLLEAIPPRDTGRDEDSGRSESDPSPILAEIPPPLPILAEMSGFDTGDDTAGADSILAGLEDRLDTGEETKIKEGRRVHFFPGKRKLKNGTTKKTGRIYWEWAFRDPETGARRRPYGGTLDKLPGEYRYRIGEYFKRSRATEGSDRGSRSLADSLFRFIEAQFQAHDPGESEG